MLLIITLKGTKNTHFKVMGFINWLNTEAWVCSTPQQAKASLSVNLGMINTLYLLSAFNVTELIIN